MDAPTTTQIAEWLGTLQKGDHLALLWAAPPGSPVARCCVAYLRVSSKRQLEGEGLGDQWAVCAAAAAREGMVIIGLYVDPAISGRKERRPAIDRLKRDAALRRFGAVLFFKVNRIGRNVRASYETAEEVERCGLTVMSATEHFRRGTAAGNLTFGMLAAVAQFGSDQLSEVMRVRLSHKAQAGLWVGPVPYGCRVLERVLTAGEQIGVVEQAWRAYATGQHSYTTLADELNAQGHRTQRGDLFGRESIRTLLKNRAYCGFVTAGGQEYEGAHGPLFADAESLWQRNQELMLARHHEGATTNTKHRQESPAFLTGLLYCECCGEKLWHHYGGRGGSLRYLICSGTSRRTCDVRQMRADAIEGQFLAIAGSLTLDPDLAARVLARARALAAPAAQAGARIDPAAIQAKLRRLGLAFADGAIDEPTYAAERDRLRAMLAETPDRPRPTPHLNEQRALGLLASLASLLPHATVHERRRIASATVGRLWVQDSQIVGLSPRADLYPLLLAWAQMNTPPSDGGGVSGGVPDGPSLPTVIPVALHHPERLKIAA